LKNGKGQIHYHCICPDRLIPNYSTDKLLKIAAKKHRKLNLLDYITVKSYAPGISHIVLDLEIDEK
jgi:tRNA G37 N-methylase Trm5